ncbi:hypothetical protein WG66_013029 [Moniliophthora roreri]|nr:hypothetical protein WG66_013029 [Moniliophthora roreri]
MREVLSVYQCVRHLEEDPDDSTEPFIRLYIYLWTMSRRIALGHGQRVWWRVEGMEFRQRVFAHSGSLDDLWYLG